MTTSIVAEMTIASGFANPLKGKSGRILLGAVPAGIVTVGLFLGMRAVIQVDGFQPEPQTTFTLEAYYVSKTGNPDGPPTIKIDKIPEVPPPPRIEPPVAEIINADFIPIGFVTPRIVPKDLAKPIKLDWSNPAVNDRTAKPIQPPIVNYPYVAAARGLEGDCEVTFDVSPRGRPFNVVAACSHQAFVKEAKRAVSKVEFMPKIWHGKPATRTGVVYPLEFRITE